MMQLEQEKLGKQLKEAEAQRSELEKIDVSKSSPQIAKGTLIQSDKGFLFISIGLGKILVDKKTVFAISPKSPLGIKLIGLKENEVAELNGTKYTIQKLF
jgi:transcription elongation GreA/GreB family factor